MFPTHKFCVLENKKPKVRILNSNALKVFLEFRKNLWIFTEFRNFPGKNTNILKDILSPI